MVRRVVEEQIIKMKIDDSEITKGANRIAKAFSGLGSKLKIDTGGIEKAGKATMAFGERISNMATKIPVIGKVASAFTDIGAAAGSNESRVGGFGAALGRLASSIPGVSAVASSLLGIGDAADNSAGRLGSLNSANFSGVSNAASDAASSIEGIGNSVDNTINKFSMLESAAAVALGNGISNLATQAMDKLKEFTIDPIMGGWADYSTELESQRILNAALEDLDGHQEIIKENMAYLESYAQTTRYSEQTMYKGLSSLVNSGVEINEAAEALKGFGNMAASSGASVEQFNNVLLTSVNQAIAMGKMDTMNWRQIENAGMATMKVKEMIAEVAIEQGTLTEEMIADYGGVGAAFTNLKDKWLTSDVFVEAMKRMAADKTLTEMAERAYTLGEAMEAVGEGVQSKWGKMFQAIFGDAENSWKIWTPLMNGLTDAATAPATAVSNLAVKLREIGGHEVVINAFANAFKSLGMIAKEIGEAFKRVFPNALSDNARMIKGLFEKLGDAFKITKSGAHGIGVAFELLLRIIQPLLGLVGAAIRVFELLIPDHLISNILTFVGIIGDLILLLIDIPTMLLGIFIPAEQVGSAFDLIAKGVKFVNDMLTSGINALGQWVAGLREGVRGTIQQWGLVWNDYEKIKAMEKNGVNPIVENMSAGERAIYNFRDKLEGVKDSLNNYKDQAVKAYNEMASGYKKYQEAAKDGVVTEKELSKMSAMERVGAQLAMKFAELKQVWSEFVEATKQGLEPLAQKLEGVFNAISRVVDGIKNKFKEIFHLDNMGASGASFMEQWASGLASGLTFVINIVEGIIKRIRGFFPNSPAKEGPLSGAGWTGVKDSGSAFLKQWIDGFGDFLAEAITFVAEGVTKITTALVDGFKNFDIKELGSNMFDGLKNGFDNLMEAFSKSDSFENMEKGFKNTKAQLDENASGFEKLGNYLKNTFFTSTKEASNAWDDFSASVKKGTIGTEFFDAAKTGFNTLIDHIKSGNTIGAKSFEISKVGAKGLTEALREQGETIAPFVTGAWNVFEFVIGKVWEVVKTLGDSVSDASLWDVTKAGTMFYALSKMAGWKNTVTELGDGIGSMFRNIKTLGDAPVKLINNFSGVLRSMSLNIKSKALLNIAKAVGILAASMLALALIPTNKVGQVMALITTLSIALAALYSVVQGFEILKAKLNAGGGGGGEGILGQILDALGLDQIGKAMNKTASAILIGTITFAVAMIIKIIKDMEGINWAKAADDVIVLASIVGGLILAVKELEKGSLKGAGKGLGSASMLIGLSIAIRMIVGIVKQVSGISTEDLLRGGAVIAAVGTFLAGAMMLMSGELTTGSFKVKTGNQGFGDAVALLAFVKGIVDIGRLIMEMASADIDPVRLQVAAGTIELLITIIGSVFAIMGGKLATTSFKVETGNMDLSDAASLFIFFNGIKKIARTIIEMASDDVSVPRLLVASAVMETLITTLGIVFAAIGGKVNFGGIQAELGNLDWSDTGALMAMTYGIAKLAKAVIKMAEHDPGSMKNAMDMMLLLIGGVVGAVSILSVLPDMETETLFALGGIVLGLIFIGGTLVQLARLDGDALGRAEIALMVITGCISAIMGVAMLAEKFVGLTGLATLVIAVGSLWVVGQTLMQLATLSWEDILQALTALGGGLAIILAAGAIASIPVVAAGLVVLAGSLVAMGFAALEFGAGALMFGTGAKLTVEALTMLWELIKTVVTDIGSAIQQLGSWLGNAFQDIPGVMASLWEGIKSTWSVFWQWILEVAPNIAKAIGDAIVAGANWVWEKAKDLWNGIVDVFKDPSKLLEKGKDLAKAVGEGIIGAIEWVKEKAKAVLDGILGIFGGGSSKSKSKGEDTGKAFGDGVGEGGKSAKSKAKSILDDVVGVFKNPPDIFASGKSFMEKFGSGISSAINNVVGKAKEALNSVRDLFPNSPAKKGPLSGSGWTRLGLSGSAFMEQWGSGIDRAKGSVVGSVSDMMSTVSDIMANGEYTPVVQFEVDQNQLDTFSANLPNNFNLSADYKDLNLQMSAMLNSQMEMQRVLGALGTVSDKLDAVEQASLSTTQAVWQKDNNTYLDSHKVNEQLAPGMNQAIEDYTARFNRLNGILPNV